MERLFRTVRDQFLSKDNSRSLEQLNQGLQNWLAQYHQRLHRSLDRSPLEKRMQVENRCRPVPEVADIEHLFLMQRRCRVYGDSCAKGYPGAVDGCLLHSGPASAGPSFWVIYLETSSASFYANQHLGLPPRAL